VLLLPGLDVLVKTRTLKLAKGAFADISADAIKLIFGGALLGERRPLLLFLAVLPVHSNNGVMRLF